MEKLHVARAAGIQAVLYRHIVDESLCLVAAAGIFAGRDTAAQHDTDTVVVETFGKAEVIVGTPTAVAAAVFIVAFHTEGDIHRLQCTSGNVADLAVEEAVQSRPHIHIAFAAAAARQVHSGDDHPDSQFGTFVFSQRVQLRLHCLVFRGSQDKLE